MASYLLKSRADSTTAKYAGYFKHFEQFCKSKCLCAKPAKAMSVCLFITGLLDEDKSYSVICACVYAIKWKHSIYGLDDPTTDSFVQHLLEAAKRLRSKPTQKKDVIDASVLVDLCTKFENDMNLINMRDLAMIIICFAGFLRYNELSKLLCSDVVFNNDHLILKIRSSKTDVYREGSEVLIAKGSGKACPYLMLERYMLAAGLTPPSEKFLFSPMLYSKGKYSFITKNKPLSYTRAREIIISKLALVAPGLKLGTHSLRASGATVAANASGLSDRCIKRHGRWRTEKAKDGYIKDSLDKKLMVTKCLGL